MSNKSAWQDLTLPQFVRCYCKKPLTNSLRAVTNLESPPVMRDIRSEADIRRVRHVGPQTATELIAILRLLGWKPRLTNVEVAHACSSAANRFDIIAARSRKLATIESRAARDLASIAEMASTASARLKGLHRQLLDLSLEAEGTGESDRWAI